MHTNMKYSAGRKSDNLIVQFAVSRILLNIKLGLKNDFPVKLREKYEIKTNVFLHKKCIWSAERPLAVHCCVNYIKYKLLS